MNRALGQICALAMDADGVLTDGGVYYSDEQSWMRFDIKDGHGIRTLIENGIVCAVISGRDSKALERRCRELGIDEYHGGISDKLAVGEKIMARLSADLSQLACIGDDLPDIPLLQRAGFSAAPADATPAVRRICDWVSSFPGGRGAVRELSELILSARGRSVHNDA